MKTRLKLLVMLGALFIISCEKAEIDSTLQGSWELSSVAGGNLANYLYPTGKGYGIKFTETEYQKYENGQIIKSGTYSLHNEKSFLNDKIMTRIIYDNDLNFPKQFIDIKRSKLTIYYGAMIATDGLEYSYQKSNVE
jgi:hypothetical protein